MSDFFLYAVIFWLWAVGADTFVDAVEERSRAGRFAAFFIWPFVVTFAAFLSLLGKREQVAKAIRAKLEAEAIAAAIASIANERRINKIRRLDS